MTRNVDWTCSQCGEVIPDALSFTTRTKGRTVHVSVGPVSDLAGVAAHVWAHTEGLAVS